ncbi:hypothetical protein XI06_06510 [Bradyrhizobium sp. CCBAU 11434]|uniref:hypothetical protein n=1 Tax=Bradyrhizobium sp. CCBAU 11434 TaxID=1630885 RepID=UPI0023066646|nr:hypothetical protein [Bradyrhizobium sp. CCBAU 11434]MDA9520021.1 hypothetical protein [Bradyrhizobium sp. CCBAU 11434]
MATKMDKQSFLNLAPEYYMLALYMYSEYSQDYYTDLAWQKEFTVRDDGAAEDYCYVESDALRAEALRLMVQHGAIAIIEDHFGPTIWQKTGEMDALVAGLEITPGNVFFKARASGNPRGWLQSALQKVNTRAYELSLTNADFDRTSIGEITLEATGEVIDVAPIDEWAPIKLDPTDPVVAEAVNKLNAATEAIEQDNGYAAERSQERDAVVSDLKGGLEKLKSGEVSIGWFKRTINALKAASITFANTVKAQTIDGAMQGLREVVKVHMKDAIEALMRLWPF